MLFRPVSISVRGEHLDWREFQLLFHLIGYGGGKVKIERVENPAFLTCHQKPPLTWDKYLMTSEEGITSSLRHLQQLVNFGEYSRFQETPEIHLILHEKAK